MHVADFEPHVAAQHSRTISPCCCAGGGRMPEITLTIGSRLENIRFIGATVRAIGLEWLGAGAAGLVEIAVTEVCTNIVRHGHPDDPRHEFTIILRGATPGLEIEIRDEGPAYAFEQDTMPSIDVDLEDLPERGFGLPLVHATMDVVEHCRQGDDNVVRLVKWPSNDDQVRA
jgi:anti-sigma regulatory factor (Ser/Thr protein kinase)